MLLVQQVSFVGILYGFKAGLQLQFIENIMDVIFHRLRCNEKPLGNFFVGQAFGN